ncbi:MAG TPA: 16S rRNA (guanine(966)-N(2))-methyltransferase RsmD [Candidatus Limnocylindria bacterium]|jgi:16S rRNA (guanine966-N2)-methyltransferase|nr:16S rRNA (guanine(966)-N(2))-methyltransferase RsmD [Candidatus Limnocylindria bacterium]
MRVIAGEAKGRTLVVPRGAGTRAATDRIRETLFAILEPELADARVLDLFAGAGTLGIEALSRGAVAATFVERGAEAVKALRRNLETTGFTGRASVISANVLAYLDGRPKGPFDVAFCDPPFADVAMAEATLGHEALRAALVLEGLVVLRSHRKHAARPPAFARVARVKEIGEERLLFLRYSGPAAGG